MCEIRNPNGHEFVHNLFRLRAHLQERWPARTASATIAADPRRVATRRSRFSGIRHAVRAHCGLQSQSPLTRTPIAHRFADMSQDFLLTRNIQ